MIKRIILIVLDSLGVGYMPDATRFDDEGANTLLHLYRARKSLEVPNLCSLGLGSIVDIGCHTNTIRGSYGRMAEKSPNKDTTTGHWEIAGIVLDRPFPTYPMGFPADLIQAFESKIEAKTLGNYPYSGTEIIKDLGPEHLATGHPIVYTSADSVFQIATHEDVVPLDRLYDYCRIARDLLVGEHSVARVIARPFKGKIGRFERDNAARKDYSITPPEESLLDVLKKKGSFVAGVGKIGDIFGHRGLTAEIHTDNNNDGVDKTIEAMQTYQDQKGLIFVNLVDFDMVYGHRRDVEGYAATLEAFDRRLPEILSAMINDDVLVVTADHGCDPTHTQHTDHTREYVPLMVYGEKIRPGIDIGTRETFADCGQTIADLLEIGTLNHGTSFKEAIIHG